MAAEQSEIVLKSNGQAIRDFIWMGDVCTIVYQLLEKVPMNDIYNVCGENTYTMLEIAHFVQEGYQEKYGETIPVRINENDKTLYSDDLKVSAQKLRGLIDYSLNIKFKEEAKKIFEMTR
jgi:UDP-glucose 4-epimerase